MRIITLDGVDYRIQPRAGQLPLVYKRYATGVYFRWCVVWGDKRRRKMPAIGSMLARVLAAAGDV